MDELDKLSVNNVIVYWDELKEFHSTDELNSKLKKLTYSTNEDHKHSAYIQILDFGEIQTPNIRKIK